MTPGRPRCTPGYRRITAGSAALFSLPSSLSPPRSPVRIPIPFPYPRHTSSARAGALCSWRLHSPPGPSRCRSRRALTSPRRSAYLHPTPPLPPPANSDRALPFSSPPPPLSRRLSRPINARGNATALLRVAARRGEGGRGRKPRRGGAGRGYTRRYGPCRARTWRGSPRALHTRGAHTPPPPPPCVGHRGSLRALQGPPHAMQAAGDRPAPCTRVGAAPTMLGHPQTGSA